MHGRRRLLALGAALPFIRAAQAAPCLLAAEQEIGPFYIADEAMRSDIVEDRVGLPLELRLVVLDSRTCRPLPQAAVDLWHCDAMGLYSGFTQAMPMGPPPGGPSSDRPPPPDGAPRGGPPPGWPPFGGSPPVNRPTDKFTFLRGIQRTDRDGLARFRTIFPGIYPGRTNHIHFKVHVADHVAHVGQVFFPEEVALSTMQRAPYSDHRIRRTAQLEDGIFRGQGGAASLAAVRMDGQETAMVADLAVAVDPTATPAPVGGGAPPR